MISASLMPSMRDSPSRTFMRTQFDSSRSDSVEPSVVNEYMARMSLDRFLMLMPSAFTSEGSDGSARRTAFCTLTCAMSVSVPGSKVIVSE